MERIKYVDTICEIINSTRFKHKIISINSNYSNLKQESFIRNAILEELNKIFLDHNLGIKAFAEHPRINRSRVDLAIVNNQDKENPFRIEFKFQFSKDDNNMENYHRVINKDFEYRNSDLFILAIADWNIKSKKEYDKKWNITSNLSRYISKNDKWKQNIINSFSKFKNAELIEFEKFEIDLPYKTEYYFYLFKRK